MKKAICIILSCVLSALFLNSAWPAAASDAYEAYNDLYSAVNQCIVEMQYGSDDSAFDPDQYEKFKYTRIVDNEPDDISKIVVEFNADYEEENLLAFSEYFKANSIDESMVELRPVENLAEPEVQRAYWLIQEWIKTQRSAEPFCAVMTADLGYFFFRDMEDPDSPRLQQVVVTILAQAWKNHAACFTDFLAENGIDQDLIFYMEAQMAPASDSQKSANKCGDVNLDNEINIVDAVTLSHAVAEMIVLNDQAKAVADVNGDQSIDAQDTVTLLRFIVGSIKVLG